MKQSVSITKRDMKRKLKGGKAVTLTRYIVHYTDPRSRKRAEKFFEKKRDAEEFQRELLVAFQQGHYITDKDLTVAEGFEHWVKSREGQIKSNTLDGYKKYKPYIVGPLLTGTRHDRFMQSYKKLEPDSKNCINMLGDVKISQLTTGAIRLWHKSVSETVSYYTANRAMQHLGTILSLISEDFEVRVPAIPKRLGRGRRREKKAILTTEQARLLVKAAKEDQKYGLYYSFGFLTGVRPSEQLGLLWKEVDFENRTIRICRIQERTGGLSEITKTESSTRTIPMCGTLYDMMLDWRDRCPRLDGELYRVFPGYGYPRRGPFPRYNEGCELLYSNFRCRIWVPAIKKLDLPPITPHSARHFFISQLQAEGIEVGVVSKLAGHANSVITLSHYTQPLKNGTEAMERLSLALT